MIEKIRKHYGFNANHVSRISAGVGGQTYLVEADNGRFVLKGVRDDDGYARNEPFIVEHLKGSGIPTAEYIKDA